MNNKLVKAWHNLKIVKATLKYTHRRIEIELPDDPITRWILYDKSASSARQEYKKKICCEAYY